MRHRLRVSVRTLMILVLFLGGGFGWIVHRAKVQREAVASVWKGGGFVFYDGEWRPGLIEPILRPWYVRWLIDRFGIDYFSNVVEVARNGGLTDAKLALIGRFASIEELHYDAYQSSITDAGLAHRVGLTRLKRLDLSRNQITDAGLAHLAGLTRLEQLYLPRTEITDAGLVHLRGMASLQKLDLSDTRMTDAGLAHLAGLTSLRTLTLSNTEISQAGFVYLKKLNNLRFLDVFGTKVDDFGGQELRRALPGTEVLFNSIMAR